MSVQDRIHNRIKGKGRGAVFAPKDFLDLGSRAAVDQALSRLVKRGVIKRLRRGIYNFPKSHPRLGDLSPKAEDVARAAVGDSAPLHMSGATAVNILGLSTQVPAKTVFLSDRAVKDIPIGNQVVQIKQVGARSLVGSNRPCGPVLQALKYLGDARVDKNVVAVLRSRVPRSVKKDLRRCVKHNRHLVPDWMRQPIDQITAEA